MMYDLPTALNVNGTEYKIRSDFRAVLDICAALSDNSMTDNEKAYAMLYVLYVDCEKIPQEDYDEAVKQAVWFIDCGDTTVSQQKRPKMMDWEKDFMWIVAPVNRVAGQEIRAMEYLHWWTFISYYYEIGDCTFAQIINIRQKRQRGKKLEKYEQEFYRQNRAYIDMHDSISESEKSLLASLQKK